MHRVGLTPDQVRLYGLPYAPLKPSEMRANDWMEQMGVEQTEVDALASLRPDLLRQIAEAAIEPFFDATLARRVAQASRAWREIAQQAIDEQMDGDAWTARAERLADIEAELISLMDEVRQDARSIELPELPDPIEPEIDEDDQPEPLCDSRWSFAEQTRALIASRDYEDS